MIVGEAPGREEDESGRPFVGRAGKILTASLDKAGIKREEVFISNVVKCRPPGNRPPTKGEIEICYNTYLSKQIHLLKPKVVLLLGKTAIRAVTGLKAFPRKHVIRSGGLDYLCTYHPAALIYNPRLKRAFNRDIAGLKTYLT
jgi:DNA polymerase